MPPSLAIVGSGISGISAAHILQESHDITLFEAAPEIGGHTHTVPLSHGPNAGCPVDMGFIVMNHLTYPLFTRFLEELGVETNETDMSFGHEDDAAGIAYGTAGLPQLFGRKGSKTDPAFWAFLLGIATFQKGLSRDLSTGRLSGLTLDAYLGENRISPAIRSHYILPMAAAIWSSGTGDMGAYPAESLARFLANHRLLQVAGQPVWRYIPGGSRTYLAAFRKRFSGIIRENSPVRSVTRDASGVTIFSRNGEERFDKVLFACHADDSLKLLADADTLEKRLLSPWRYSANRVVLHTDPRFMPKNRKIWSAWNSFGTATGRASVTYWMDHLQKLATTEPVFVTLNPETDPPPDRLHAVRLFHHPIFDFPATESRAHLPKLQNRRHTLFCGAHFGYGFHEDGIRSAVDAARILGRDW